MNDLFKFLRYPILPMVVAPSALVAGVWFITLDFTGVFWPVARTVATSMLWGWYFGLIIAVLEELLLGN